ncbi:MAG: hypothetical protein KJ767_02005 [Nanoarchaeota archaeon]|nr:hypothetical protein [Nanoarchaeota archaeon]
MIDIVKNKNKEMQDYAKELGFQDLYLLGKDAVLIENFKDKKDILKARKKYDFVIVFGKGIKENRQIVESFPDVILLQLNSGKDFMKERNSGLDHIICKIASENNVAIGIDLSEILNSNEKEKQVIIGRIMQNIKLCRKYKTKILLASFASDVFELRASQDIQAFVQCLGMTPLESKNSLLIAEKIMGKNKDKKHVSYVSEGIRIVE